VTLSVTVLEAAMCVKQVSVTQF